METLAHSPESEARQYGLDCLWWILELLLCGHLPPDVVLVLGNQDPGFLFLAVGKLTFIWFSKTVNWQR